MTTPESFRKLKRRARALLKAARKRHISDSELDDKLIDLCVDNRCQRLEELCPEPGALDQASALPVLERLRAQVRAEGLPGRSLDAVPVPEGGKHSLVVVMAYPSHPMKATHPSLKLVTLPHGDLERAMPWEFRIRLRGEAAQKRLVERLDLALQDKVEELLLLFPQLAEQPPFAAHPDEIEAKISAAQLSDDPPQAFRKLLRLTDWTPRAWADAAVCSESSISRWINSKPVTRCNAAIRTALHQRLREYWPKVCGITFEKLKPPLKD